MAFNPEKFVKKSEPKKQSDILLNAALMYDFDIKKDFSGFTDSQIKELEEKSLQRVDGRYTLSESYRNDIINNEIGVSNLVREIEKRGIRTDFTEALQSVAQESIKDYNKLSTSQLFYSGKVAELFPERVDLGVIQSEVSRRQFFAPFERLTLNFAGRKEELSKINDYVNWLPPQKMVTKITNAIRNMFGWESKPPMLIQGIGGIGKSTLVAKFILEQNQSLNSKKLPFVYIDFDLPGFSLVEPLSILIEGFRQLSIQYPAQNEIFNEIIRSITDLSFSNEIPGKVSHQSSSHTSRSFVYDNLEKIIEQYQISLMDINIPLLVVFDSFEEMQYRAGRHELNRFFTFIKELSFRIPRIRVIFVGRSEIYERVDDLEFLKLELKEFDKESAKAFLNNKGVADIQICENILKKMGGNPLVLQLAADLVKKDSTFANDLKKLKNVSRDFLIRRILDHIHNPEVRQIAIPGMLVRVINPEIIKEVLAEPCGLGEINDEKAKDIFEELVKETALVSTHTENGEIMFRQDLRMACEKMVLENYPEASKKITTSIIAFYSSAEKSKRNEAEYYYHILKKGETPPELEKEKYTYLQSYLEASLKEFPKNSQMYIGQLLSAKVEKSIIYDSTTENYEQYYINHITSALSGEVGLLHTLYREINSRNIKNEESDSEFSFYHALLCQRLNKLGEANKIIDTKLKILSSRNSTQNQQTRDLLFLKAQNLEYVEKYDESLAIVETLYRFQMMKKEESFQVNYLRERLLSRLNNNGINTLEKVIFGSYAGFRKDIHWDFIYANSKKRQIRFFESQDFEIPYYSIKRRKLNLNHIENICYENLGLFTKDIALAGEFDIVLIDFLKVLEAMNSYQDILELYS